VVRDIGVSRADHQPHARRGSARHRTAGAGAAELSSPRRRAGRPRARTDPERLPRHGGEHRASEERAAGATAGDGDPYRPVPDRRVGEPGDRGDRPLPAAPAAGGAAADRRPPARAGAAGLPGDGGAAEHPVGAAGRAGGDAADRGRRWRDGITLPTVRLHLRAWREGLQVRRHGDRRRSRRWSRSWCVWRRRAVWRWSSSTHRRSPTSGASARCCGTDTVECRPVLAYNGERRARTAEGEQPRNSQSSRRPRWIRSSSRCRWTRSASKASGQRRLQLAFDRVRSDGDLLDLTRACRAARAAPFNCATARPAASA
jgi:hypothetical protein